MAVHAEGDEVAPPQSGVAGQWTLLRDVPDTSVAATAHLFPERLDASGAQPLEAEDRAQQRGLSRSARPEDRDQLARLDREVQAAPQLAITAAERRAAYLEGRGARDRGSHESSAPARASMFACIHER